MILQHPGRNIQEPLGILVESWQAIQEVKRWVDKLIDTRVDLTCKSYYAPNTVTQKKTAYGNTLSFLFFFYGHSIVAL